MAALGTGGVGLVHVLPSFLASQHVVHRFLLQSYRGHNRFDDLVGVRTGGTEALQSKVALSHAKQVCTRRTKHHRHGALGLARSLPPCTRRSSKADKPSLAALSHVRLDRSTGMGDEAVRKWRLSDGRCLQSSTAAMVEFAWSGRETLMG
mmetsp:Transcript_8233/g.51263  ORF Transcript_8233/g.51263 Transcript_8233/m.51263 type:complete len:150 (+) Transcript_8233:1553-2002(+)